MGRGKVVLKKIEKSSNRLVTFSKRKKGLMKKANELAVLCDVDVALIVYSDNGKLYEYSSSRMESILGRYKEVPESSEPAIVETVAPEESQTELEALKVEVEMLCKMQSGLLAKDLKGLCFSDLQQLEHMFNEGLSIVKDHMEKKVKIEQVGELQRELAMEQNSVGEIDTSLRVGLTVDTSLNL